MKRFIIFMTTLMFMLCAGLGLCFEVSAATQSDGELIFRDFVETTHSERFYNTIKAYSDGTIVIACQRMSCGTQTGTVGSFCLDDTKIDFVKTVQTGGFSKIESYNENNWIVYTIMWDDHFQEVGDMYEISFKVKEKYLKYVQRVIFFNKEIEIPFGTEKIFDIDLEEIAELKSANAALTEQNSLLSAEKDYLSSQLQEAKDEITVLNADLTTYKAIAQALTEAANQKTEEIRLLKISQEELETKIKQLTNNPDNADFNNDGRITVADAVYFLVYLANKPSTMVEWIE